MKKMLEYLEEGIAAATDPLMGKKIKFEKYNVEGTVVGASKLDVQVKLTDGKKITILKSDIAKKGPEDTPDYIVTSAGYDNEMK